MRLRQAVTLFAPREDDHLPFLSVSVRDSLEGMVVVRLYRIIFMEGGNGAFDASHHAVVQG